MESKHVFRCHFGSICLIVEVKVSFEKEEKRNIFKQPFSKFKLAEGGWNQAWKRQLFAYATFEIEKCMAKKPYFSCIQICAPFICWLSTFLSIYEEMAKG